MHGSISALFGEEVFLLHDESCHTVCINCMHDFLGIFTAAKIRRKNQFRHYSSSFDGNISGVVVGEVAKQLRYISIVRYVSIQRHVSYQIIGNNHDSIARINSVFILRHHRGSYIRRVLSLVKTCKMFCNFLSFVVIVWLIGCGDFMRFYAILFDFSAISLRTLPTSYNFFK